MDFAPAKSADDQWSPLQYGRKPMQILPCMALSLRQKNTKSPHYYRSAGFACLLQAKTLVETINTSTGVNQLLLAGIERVALGADFDSDVLLGRTSGKDIAASAADGSLIVLGMETFLHCCSPLSY
jgi:hypothetical protein